MEVELAMGGVTVVLLFAYVIAHKRNNSKYKNIPPATPRMPLVGNALTLDLSRCHKALTDWAEKFGPVYRIKIYGEEILVLNSCQSVHDALVVQGSAFAGRPPMYRTAKEDRDKHSIVWQTYTDKLVFLRKEVTKSLKMYGDGMDNLEQKCAPEIKTMLEKLAGYKGQPFDPWDHIYDAISNVMLGLTLDTTFDHASHSFQMIKDINGLFNDTFGTGKARGMDFLPFLSKLNLHAYSDRLQTALNLRDQFWMKELALLKDRGDADCIVQRLLALIPDPKYKGYDVCEATAKEVFTNLILAGTDTTATTLTCLLLVFLHHPEVQEKMWAEVKHQIGENRLATLADRKNMPYFQAVLLELLRYISHVPLAVPHYTTCDTSVLGIPVPKDMTVYINLWAVHHDPQEWEEPWRFRPERFLDKEGQLLPITDPIRRKLMVFGGGRRVCLGEALAKNRLFLFASALVQNFKFLPSADNLAQLPDLDPRTYDMGLVLHPKHYQLRAFPRH
ncbi:cytochrome P450 1A1-like [Physella acuta]|uniref:cytochrome P450 1A1-like n=1 Tax=Physella acuta TaxID=109671 RepID=UPI0027DABB51|nr:cytochrome P450 1A1-like [Physella acuta]